MICDKKIYDRGSYWFKKIIDKYKNKNLYVKYMRKNNYARIYFRTPLYDYLLVDIPLDIGVYALYRKTQSELLNNFSVYQELERKNLMDKVKESVNKIHGYISATTVIDRRLYLLANNQDFLETAIGNAKGLIELH